MNPNAEQIKSAIRFIVQNFGAAIAGWFAAKGYFTIDQVTGVLNSPVYMGLVASIIAGVWGLFVHKQSNAVAVANAIPQVAGVIMSNTGDGRALAASVGAAGAVVAGTNAAAVVAAVPPSTFVPPGIRSTK